MHNDKKIKLFNDYDSELATSELQYEASKQAAVKAHTLDG